jgi:SulP family sulfate permease
MNSLKPMLLSSLKSYDKSQFFKDVTAGIIVAIIALPLSIALALASGVGPEAGIFTAIVAGFVISALGGSSVQIAGPTAAFATIVAGIVAHDGMDGLIVATILAGIFFDFDGSMSFWKSNQVYSIYHYDRFYFGYCRYDCDWAIKRFFWINLSNGSKAY